jgi:hypothetical protein
MELIKGVPTPDNRTETSQPVSVEEGIVFSNQERRHLTEIEVTDMLLNGKISRDEYDFQIDAMAMDEDSERRKLERAEKKAKPTWLGRVAFGS